MKLLVKTLVMVCAVGIGLSAGFALRKKAAAGTEISPAVESSSEGSPGNFSRNSKSRVRQLPRDDSPLATRLDRDLSMSQGVTRWLYWLAAIEKATPPDFPRLVKLAQGTPGALRLVTDRWIEFAPRHLFDTLVAAEKGGVQLPPEVLNQLVNSLFDQWTRRDPEAVVAALSSSGDFGARSQWQREVAINLVETNPEMGLRLMSEYHIENHSPRMNGVAKWAAENPQHAAEFALAHPAGSGTETAMETIGKEWAKKDPARALEFAAKYPGRFGDKLGAAALKEWAARDFNEAGNWLAGADAQTRNNFSPAFVETWAKRDRAGALAWCEANLTGSSLVQAIGGVLQGAAEKNLAAAARLVTELNPSAARAEAAVAVARKWFPDQFENKPFKPEAVTWLTGLDGDSIRRVVAEVGWRWAATDSKSMAAFLASHVNDVTSDQPYGVVVREMARTDPVGALAWANQLPSEHALSTGVTAFSGWNTSQPEAAMKWLDTLPATDSRRQPFFENAIRSMTFDTQAVERLAALPATDRAAARTVIAGMSLPDDRRAQLLGALTGR